MQLLAKKSTTAEHTAKLHLSTQRDCESRIAVVDGVLCQFFSILKISMLQSLLHLYFTAVFT